MAVFCNSFFLNLIERAVHLLEKSPTFCGKRIMFYEKSPVLIQCNYCATMKVSSSDEELSINPFDSVKNPTTQIPMNLNFIDPQTRVLNYF